jgi:hypothetical protein
MAAVRSRWIPEGGHVARAGSAWFFTAVVLVIAVLLIAEAAGEWSARSVAFVLSALTLAHLGWALFWRPRLHIGEETITVVNPWRTEWVPWSALVNVETRFNLTLVTRDRTVHVQAAPSPGGLKALRAAGRPDKDSAAWLQQGERAGDARTTDSGGAAAVVRGHWNALVENDAVGPEEPAKGRWDAPVIAVSVTGAVMSAMAWLVRLV